MDDAFAGEALLAVMRSNEQRPAPWKLDLIRRALPAYLARWRANKSLIAVPRHTAAFAEAYSKVNDRALADFVFEINDWLCGFQYQQIDPRHPQWVGGFMSCMDAKPAQASPQIISAAWAESLVDAARVAKQAGDVARWQRYKAASELCLQFLTTLQYTEANSQHFAPWYHPAILGAFHESHTDGNIRLEHTQQAVSAMVTYLGHVADVGH
jgi:hypothetical protein